MNMKKQTSYLAALDVFGFDRVEPAILAALVTEDPLLLIGRSGTGKTYLLNSLSEALGLEHRHYNASLVSFDDLVGFPYPDEGNGGIKFLETPATVWGAESVLIDEISRCKPEHQNRLFSLVHERRVQGIAIPRLRFRWAAMNPCGSDQDGTESYTGSEPLDPALADRFALFVWAVDWNDLSEENRLRVADPSGEGKLADDGGQLRTQLESWRREFTEQLPQCPRFVLEYTAAVVSALNGADIRVSPRRARLLARSLLAATIVHGRSTPALYRLILKCSLPQVAWGVEIDSHVVAAAHRAAWDQASASDGAWVHAFLAERSLPRKLELLLEQCQDPDQGTQAISQFVAAESPERAAALCFALYPAAVMGKLPIGAEGVNDLGKIAGEVMKVKGSVSWQVHRNDPDTPHPDIESYARILARRRRGRRERAKQLFDWCLVNKVRPEDPAGLEMQLNACVQLLKKRGLA
jgi:MoxR-like ATPase